MDLENELKKLVKENRDVDLKLEEVMDDIALIEAAKTINWNA